MGLGGALVQARNVKAAGMGLRRKARESRAVSGKLLSGERLGSAGLGKGIAPIELGRRKGAAVDKEAFDRARAFH